MMLTEAERHKFADWLEHEAMTSQGLIVQMEKVGGPFAALATRYRGEAAAMILIAKKLRSIESFTVEG